MLTKQSQMTRFPLMTSAVVGRISSSLDGVKDGRVRPALHYQCKLHYQYK
jgi:hypothetical protein